MQLFKIELTARLGEKETEKFEYDLCAITLDEISKSIHLLVKSWEYENLEWDYINISVFQILEHATTFFFAGQMINDNSGLIYLL